MMRKDKIGKYSEAEFNQHLQLTVSLAELAMPSICKRHLQQAIYSKQIVVYLFSAS